MFPSRFLCRSSVFLHSVTCATVINNTNTLFTWSLKENTVPFTWKTSVIIMYWSTTTTFFYPCLNDYRPLVLTRNVLKCFERIILHQLIILHRLMKHTKPHLDPYQFAYKHNRNTEDATLTPLHNAYTHLEKKNRFICPNSLRRLC